MRSPALAERSRQGVPGDAARQWTPRYGGLPSGPAPASTTTSTKRVVIRAQLSGIDRTLSTVDENQLRVAGCGPTSVIRTPSIAGMESSTAFRAHRPPARRDRQHKASASCHNGYLEIVFTQAPVTGRRIPINIENESQEGGAMTVCGSDSDPRDLASDILDGKILAAGQDFVVISGSRPAPSLTQAQP